MTENTRPSRRCAIKATAAAAAGSAAATALLPDRAWAAPITLPKQAVEYVQMGCDGIAIVLGFIGVILIVFGIVGIARTMNDSSGMGQSNSATQFGAAALLFIAAAIVKLAPGMLLG